MWCLPPPLLLLGRRKHRQKKLGRHQHLQKELEDRDVHNLAGHCNNGATGRYQLFDDYGHYATGVFYGGKLLAFDDLFTREQQRRWNGLSFNTFAVFLVNKYLSWGEHLYHHLECTSWTRQQKRRWGGNSFNTFAVFLEETEVVNLMQSGAASSSRSSTGGDGGDSVTVEGRDRRSGTSSWELTEAERAELLALGWDDQMVGDLADMLDFLSELRDQGGTEAVAWAAGRWTAGGVQADVAVEAVTDVVLRRLTSCAEQYPGEYQVRGSCRDVYKTHGLDRLYLTPVGLSGRLFMLAPPLTTFEKLVTKFDADVFVDVQRKKLYWNNMGWQILFGVLFANYFVDFATRRLGKYMGRRLKEHVLFPVEVALARVLRRLRQVLGVTSLLLYLHELLANYVQEKAQVVRPTLGRALKTLVLLDLWVGCLFLLGRTPRNYFLDYLFALPLLYLLKCRRVVHFLYVLRVLTKVRLFYLSLGCLLLETLTVPRVYLQLWRMPLALGWLLWNYFLLVLYKLCLLYLPRRLGVVNFLFVLRELQKVRLCYLYLGVCLWLETLLEMVRLLYLLEMGGLPVLPTAPTESALGSGVVVADGTSVGDEEASVGSSLRPALPARTPGADDGSPVLPVLHGVSALALSATGTLQSASEVDDVNTERGGS
ncbi:hypothetical protein AK812_SmicGene23967 [Symbiodinium microadriaticum]|uniref:Uncharacterized protein n=1 Tax=Symbiodinium microadriaticum TaxID=2951 RepID=A0A1Q9DFV9_SYMMI|nr:hypothetical protein AK812_SmicGene23967 [Symbiodinium microadriaticum]CAE7034166.1 unnamed protein product [Symbiodinium sp. KB8]CAE7786633.1 unnamed protein product [Symbiodinium microadriaticum]